MDIAKLANAYSSSLKYIPLVKKTVDTYANPSVKSIVETANAFKVFKETGKYDYDYNSSPYSETNTNLQRSNSDYNFLEELKHHGMDNIGKSGLRESQSIK